MVKNDLLRTPIVERFDDMSQQLQLAARYILKHPQEVALVSMRELARNAGAQPSTMSRLAKILGFSGYEDVRSHYAGVIRDCTDGFAARALQREVSVRMATDWRSACSKVRRRKLPDPGQADVWPSQRMANPDTSRRIWPYE